jgi:orotate phosphoribosyltransferase
MMDLPDKKTRIVLGTHADFKAKVYKTANAALFIESSYSQAQEIARHSGKSVFCTETWQIVDPNYLTWGYRRGKELIVKAMINPLKALLRILSFTRRKLSTLRWKILAKLKKNRHS